jgi:hypothetical protein
MTFNGIATLMTSRPDLGGPYARPVSADLLVDERGIVTVSALHLAPVKVGSVTCRITQLPKTGLGTHSNGDLRLTIGLHVGIDVLRGAADSEIMLALATDSTGSKVTADGQVTLVGSATFQKGYLGGRLATFVVNGTISPVAVVQPRRSAA